MRARKSRRDAGAYSATYSAVTLVTAAVLGCILGCSPASTKGRVSEPGRARLQGDDVAEASSAGLAPSSATLPPIHYDIALSDDLRTLTERVCFEGTAPRSVTSSKDGERFVRAATASDGSELAFASGIIETRGLDNGCLTLEIDTRSMIGLAGGWGMGTRALDVDGDLVLSPSYWLWYPGRKSERAPAKVHFELPAGIDVAVGWRRAPGSDPHAFELLPGDYDWRTHAAFGRFELRRVRVGTGQTIELAALGPNTPADLDALQVWITSAANAVADLFDGTFPRPRATVVVVPVPGGRGGGGPVHFGLVVRGGEPAILFFVANAAEPSTLEGEWVAVHELTHLAMPYVRKRDAWLSEGIATYYQEVLRARAGLYPVEPTAVAQLQAAIEKMQRGFARGLQGAERLSLEEASDGMRGGFGRVYWGGAIVAFLVDLELRAATQGEHGLEDVLRSWMNCCGTQTKIWSADELLGAISADVEAWTGDPHRLERQIRTLIEAKPTPDPTDRWAEFGASVDERGRASLDDAPSSPENDLRAKIFGAPSARSARQTRR